MKHAFEASAFADRDKAGDFAYELVVKGTQRAGGYPIAPLGEALYALVWGLLEADGLVFGFPVIESFGALSIDEGIKLRSYLRRKERFLANADQFVALWQHKVACIIDGIVRSLPDAFLVDTPPTADDASDATMSTPLIDLCHEPDVVIERVAATFCDDDITDAGMFEPIREALDRNFLSASGIDPHRTHDFQKKLVLPTQMNGRAPRDLAATYFAGTPLLAFFDARLPFSIPFPARFEHTHIVGGSGHGKTQLMQSMIHEDLILSQSDGRSVVVIDSQGDLIKTISHLALFAPGADNSLAERLVIVDPADIAFPVCLNLFDWGEKRLDGASPVEREKLLNSAIGLYEYMFGALLGAELTQKQGVIFKYLARLMLEIPDATIHTLAALMEDGRPFIPHMERLTGSARSFFATRFFDRSFNETKKQILTRLWGVLSNSTLERIFGSPRNKIDLYEALNSGKIVLINTAKDLLTQGGAALFGRFFIALIAQAAVQRAAIAPYDRRSAFVYIDEAADYFDDNIEHLLNQARKYKVGLILAHQNLDQLSTELRASLMASTSIKFAGGVSGKDARALCEEMHCDPEFLQRMRKRKEDTEFACFVRSFTPRATAVTVPLGYVERQPVISEREYDLRIERNRRTYCVPLEEALQAGNRGAVLKEEPVFARDAERPKRQTGRKEAPSSSTTPMVRDEAPVSDIGPSKNPIPPGMPAPEQRAGNPPPASAEEGQREPAAPALRPSPQTRPDVTPKRAREPKPTVPLGRGGKQHQYLQHFIKGIAEERGWRAAIEEPILDGAGRIDVLLSRSGRRIACEISVTTSRDHELGNVEKCLAGGHTEIILLAGADRQRQMLQKYIAAALDEVDREKVKYLLPDEMLQYLESLEPPTEQTVRGYRVTVKKREIDAADSDARRKAIAAIIARSLKQPPAT